jgi:hypothetical protein
MAAQSINIILKNMSGEIITFSIDPYNPNINTIFTDHTITHLLPGVKRSCIRFLRSNDSTDLTNPPLENNEIIMAVCNIEREIKPLVRDNDEYKVLADLIKRNDVDELTNHLRQTENSNIKYTKTDPMIYHMRPTPLLYAISFGNKNDVINVLLKYGADPKEKTVLGESMDALRYYLDRHIKYRPNDGATESYIDPSILAYLIENCDIKSDAIFLFPYRDVNYNLLEEYVLKIRDAFRKDDIAAIHKYYMIIELLLEQGLCLENLDIDMTYDDSDEPYFGDLPDELLDLLRTAKPAQVLQFAKRKNRKSRRKSPKKNSRKSPKKNSRRKSPKKNSRKSPKKNSRRKSPKKNSRRKSPKH